MIQKIRNSISGRRLWNVQVFCASYLPDWRPERDYRETSSAKLDFGGGVLLDMSHELDYIQWLVGPIEVTHAVSKKVSDLKIDSDDLLLLSGKTKEGTHLHISLNYFTRKSQRQILIDGEDISIRADLDTNTLSMVEKGEASDYSWPELERNETYRAQHQAILEGDMSKICSFEQGLQTMHLIERIRSWSKG
jgi:CMP-N,N'-diacetyllegionaminic acid synthase